MIAPRGAGGEGSPTPDGKILKFQFFYDFPNIYLSICSCL